ncbi:MAG: ABC transporter substrate-binding protein [Actinomycetota bacterium]
MKRDWREPIPPEPGEPIPSYELPRRKARNRSEAARWEHEMEERSKAGWDTPVNRREFLDLSRKLGLGVAASSMLYPLFLAACGKTASDLSTSSGPRFSAGSEDTSGVINIGVISIYSGVGAFVGKLVEHGAGLAIEQINAHGVPDAKMMTANHGFPDFDAYAKQTPGGINIGGKRVKLNLIQRDDNLSAQVAVSNITEMITRDNIKGLIFAGLYDDIYAAKKILQQVNLPAIAAFGDLYSVDQLWPKTDYRQLFQMFPPDLWGIELSLEEYALVDRGYSRFAYLGDNTAVGAQGKRLITEVLARHGSSLLATEQYNVGDVDMTAQLQRIKATNCNALLVWGIAGDTAHALENLQSLDAVYVDHPTALGAGGGWHPQIIGFEGGAAERTFAVLAGDAARTGTMSYFYLGSVAVIPEFQTPVNLFKKRWGQAPTGGENNPADAIFLFATAFQNAGGTDPAKVIDALEHINGVHFSSLTPHSFTKDRHISIEKDDIIGVTLERGAPAPTDPAYQLGTEFTGRGSVAPFFPPGYVGPTHFMRFNQAGLMRKHPHLYGDILLKNGYGTQCTKRPDPTSPYGFKLTNECKIH